MTRLSILSGLKGFKGAAGLDGVTVGDVRASVVENPLFSAFDSNNINEDITWYRAARENLQLYSRIYSDGWSLFSCTIIENDINNHLGNLVASRMTSTSGQGVIFPLGSENYIIGEVNTFSVYLKAGSTGNIKLGFDGSNYVNFDISAGTQGTTVGSIDSAGITNEGSGWYRVYITHNMTDRNSQPLIYWGSTTGHYIYAWGVQNEASPTPTQLIETDGAIAVEGGECTIVDRYGVIQNLPANTIRYNEKGYLIEAYSENISTNSEDLSAWTTQGCTIGQYIGEDPSGVTNKNIKLTMTAGVAVLNNSCIPVVGESYSVSFWLLDTSGAVSSVRCSVGGGASVEVSEIPSASFKRVSAQCISGSSPNVDISVFSSSLTATPLVWGVQVEQGDLTSYIKTTTEVKVRSLDELTVPYIDNFPLPNDNWSFRFTRSESSDKPTNKYVLHNQLTGGSEFSCWLDESTFNITNGLDIHSVTSNAKNYVVTNDASNLKIYEDGVLVYTGAVVSPSATAGDTMVLFGDQNKAQQISNHVSIFRFWDETLSYNEVRYIEATQ